MKIYIIIILLLSIFRHIAESIKNPRNVPHLPNMFSLFIIMIIEGLAIYFTLIL